MFKTYRYEFEVSIEGKNMLITLPNSLNHSLPAVRRLVGLVQEHIANFYVNVQELLYEPEIPFILKVQNNQCYQ